MSKVIFVVHRRVGSSRAECYEQWAGERHVSLVTQLPGLERLVQNHVVSAPGEPVCDGIGELWFEDDDAMHAALGSPELGAAVEHAKGFLDMDRTGMILVSEKILLGSPAELAAE